MNSQTNYAKQMKPSMKKYIIALAALLLGAAQQAAHAQSWAAYEEDVTVKIPGILTNGQVLGLASGTEKQTTRQYVDGLGRPIQTVAVKASPAGKDMIQPVAYDNAGRQLYNYLPFTGTGSTGGFDSTALANQSAFYLSNMSNKIAVDSMPFSQRVFESSPLQRLLKQGTVGNGFQTNQHYKTVTYAANITGDAVRQWLPDGTSSGTYAANSLSAMKATDEQGVATVTFTDNLGRTILKRQLVSETIGGIAETGLDTYYIYNEDGSVAYVAPPKATAVMRNNANYDVSTVSGLIFKFVYDTRGRLTQKTVPAGPTLYIVYDPLSRPVLMQDGNMRAHNQWNYIKYDAKGRAVSQGIYTDNTYTTFAAMQGHVDGLDYSTNYYENRSGTLTNNGYYTNNIFPGASIQPLSYVYYDDYDLNLDGTADYSYQAQSLPGEASATPYVRGMLTAVSKTTVGDGIASGKWLTTAVFYDKQGRTIQSQSNNHTNAAATLTDTKTIVPDFTGKTLEDKTVKVIYSSTTTVYTLYAYDNSNRLTALNQKYNSDTTTIHIAGYQYNELGQLVTKNLQPSAAAPPANITLGTGDSMSSGTIAYQASNRITLTPNFSVASGATFRASIHGAGALQTIDYRYNIRGQLLSMNNSTLTNNGTNNSDDKDAFGMELLYDQTDASLGNTALFNGMVSAVKWMAKTATLTERSYVYSYDDQNRLATAGYHDRAAGAGSWTNAGGYDEKNISYDHNGNILALQRTAMVSGSAQPIDDLQYTYSGNRLATVTDGTGGSYAALGFRNLTGSAGSYSYDDNGNISADPYKGLTTAYNVLNRSGKVTITTATGRYIDYTYDATGTLIKKQQYDNSILQKTTDYVDGFVAENSTLIYFAMPEGKVMNTGGTLKTQYLIADQQGNVRVSVEDNGNNIAVVKQENSYYPFGLIMPNSQIALPSQPNKNLYNSGSEWQNDYGDLPDLYQTFYRSYDAALGRFTGVDPMAEGAESLSPYQYAGNNPISYNDPLGNDFQRDEHGNLIPQAASRYTDGPGDEKFQQWVNNTTGHIENGDYGSYLDGKLFAQLLASGTAITNPTTIASVVGAVNAGNIFNLRTDANGNLGYDYVAQYGYYTPDHSSISDPITGSDIGNRYPIWGHRNLGQANANEDGNENEQGINWGKVGDGTLITITGAVMTVGGIYSISSGVGVSVGTSATVTGMSTMGFGIVRIINGFQGKKTETPGGLGEAVDNAFGGNGKFGQIFDLFSGGVPKSAVEIGLFSYGISTSHLGNFLFNGGQVNANGIPLIQRDNTRVVLPNLYH